MNGYLFDYRLGYVRDGTALQGGFDVIGNPEAENRVVTLGGYTTPDMAKSGASWANALSARMGGTAQILNGCTDGFATPQMLTMLIRDVILLKPERVICLSGFCNLAYKLGLVENRADREFLRAHPFATPRQLQFLREITSHLGLGRGEVFYGCENEEPASALWLRQTAEMHAICEEFGIGFRAYLQPCVFSGGYQRSESESAALRGQYGLTDPELAAFHNEFQRSYGELQAGLAGLDYITDLSGLFDGETEVYTDVQHVRDAYLPRIAEAIL